jgi:Protein of unknown function (DUF2721)
MPLESNPFAILTFIAAPAVLTNASSVLALGTSNRFARNVDRLRVIIKLLDVEKGLIPTPLTELYRDQIRQYERRGFLLVRALSSLYFSIGCFAGGSLMSLLGAILSSSNHPNLLQPVLILALLAGVAGLSGLIVGCSLLVRETRLAMHTIMEEAALYRTHFGLEQA